MNRRVAPSGGRHQTLTAEPSRTNIKNEFGYGRPFDVAVCCIIASVAAMLVASIQSGFFTVLRPFGTVPDLCLAFTVALGLTFGSRFGSVFGVAAGFFIDALSAEGLSLKILLYLVCGALSGILKIPESRPIKDIWRYLAILSSVCAAKQFITALRVILTAPVLDMARLFTRLFISELACTVIFSIPVYLTVSTVFAVTKRLWGTKRKVIGR